MHILWTIVFYRWYEMFDKIRDIHLQIGLLSISINILEILNLRFLKVRTDVERCKSKSLYTKVFLCYIQLSER